MLTIFGISSVVGYIVYLAFLEFMITLCFKTATGVAELFFPSSNSEVWDLNFGSLTTNLNIQINGSSYSLYNGLQIVGTALIGLIFVITIILNIKKTAYGGQAESWVEMFGRLILATFFLYYWHDLYDIVVDNVIDPFLKMFGFTLSTPSFKLDGGLDFHYTLAALMIGFMYASSVCATGIYFIERWITLGVTTMIAPLCIPFYVNRDSEGVCKAWAQALGTQLLGILLSIAFICLYNQKIDIFKDKAITAIFNNEEQSGYLVKLVAAIVFLRLSCNSEKILNMVGLRTTSFGDVAQAIGGNFSQALGTWKRAVATVAAANAAVAAGGIAGAASGASAAGAGGSGLSALAPTSGAAWKGMGKGMAQRGLSAISEGALGREGMVLGKSMSNLAGAISDSKSAKAAQSEPISATDADAFNTMLKSKSLSSDTKAQMGNARNAADVYKAAGAGMANSLSESSVKSMVEPTGAKNADGSNQYRLSQSGQEQMKRDIATNTGQTLSNNQNGTEIMSGAYANQLCARASAMDYTQNALDGKGYSDIVKDANGTLAGGNSVTNTDNLTKSVGGGHTVGGMSVQKEMPNATDAQGNSISATSATVMAPQRMSVESSDGTSIGGAIMANMDGKSVILSNKANLDQIAPNINVSGTDSTGPATATLSGARYDGAANAGLNSAPTTIGTIGKGVQTEGGMYAYEISGASTGQKGAGSTYNVPQEIYNRCEPVPTLESVQHASASGVNATQSIGGGYADASVDGNAAVSNRHAGADNTGYEAIHAHGNTQSVDLAPDRISDYENRHASGNNDTVVSAPMGASGGNTSYASQSSNNAGVNAQSIGNGGYAASSENVAVSGGYAANNNATYSPAQASENTQPLETIPSNASIGHSEPTGNAGYAQQYSNPGTRYGSTPSSPDTSDEIDDYFGHSGSAGTVNTVPSASVGHVNYSQNTPEPSLTDRQTSYASNNSVETPGVAAGESYTPRHVTVESNNASEPSLTSNQSNYVPRHGGVDRTVNVANNTYEAPTADYRRGRNTVNTPLGSEPPLVDNNHASYSSDAFAELNESEEKKQSFGKSAKHAKNNGYDRGR